MSGFIATGATTAEHKIENDAFWPVIDCLDLRAAMRLNNNQARFNHATVRRPRRHRIRW